MPSLVSTEITFQVETWAEYVAEARALWPIHYEELALNKDKAKLSIDEARYSGADKNGALHIVTVRADGKLVGYYIAAILIHLRYQEAGLMAFADMYYLLPKYRVGGCGAKWLLYIEQTLRERGVQKAYLSCKVHQDHSQLFTALGWTPSDMVFTKWLGK